MKKSTLLFFVLLMSWIVQANVCFGAEFNDSGTKNGILSTEFGISSYKAIYPELQTELDVAAVTTFPFFEGFEQTTAPPTNWTMIYANTGHPSGNDMITTEAYKFGGNRSFRFSSMSSGSPYDQYLITPEMDLGGTNKVVRFYYRTNYNYTETFRVGTSTTGNAVTDFTWGTDITNAENSDMWKCFEIEVDALVKYVSIHYKSNYMYYLYIDNFEVKDVIDCERPTNIVASNVTSNSATIGWTLPTTEPSNGYDIYYSNNLQSMPTSETLPIASVNAGVTSIDISTLNIATTYYVWLRSNCGGIVSDWTYPISFLTLCDIFPVPFVEDFSSTVFPPNCWSRKSLLYTPDAVMTSSSMTDGSNYWTREITAGNYAARINIWTTDRRNWLISPSINIGNTGNYGLEFDVKLADNSDGTGNPARGSDDKFVVLISTDDGVTWDPANAIEWSYAEGADFPYSNLNKNYQSIVIPLTGMSGNIRFAFYGESTVANADDYLFVDNIGITDCLKPSNITINPTLASTTFSWTHPTATDFILEYRRVIDTDWTPVNVSGLTYSLPLTPSTEYMVRMKAECGSGDYSTYSSEILFMTPCDTYTVPFYEDYTSTTFPPLCWERKSLLYTPDAVMLNSSMTDVTTYWTRESTGGNYAARINIYTTDRKYWLISPPINIGNTGNYGLEFNVKLSDNSDGTGIPSYGTDDKFIVIVSTDDGATWDPINAKVWSASVDADYSYRSLNKDYQAVTIPLSGYTGNIKVAFYGESTVSNANDYLFVDNISISDCYKPYNVITYLNPTSVNISWAHPYLTDFVFEYKLSSATEWTEQVVSGLTYAMTVLPNTSYDIRIKAECSVGEYSDYTSTITFLTPCLPSDLPIYENFDNTNNGTSSIPNAPDCWKYIRDNSSSYAYVQTINSSYSQPNNYYLYNSSASAGQATALVSSYFSEPINTLRTRFMAKGSSDYTLKVGYMTNPSDFSTFVIKETVTLTSEWQEYIVSFSDVTGTGNYVTFQHGNSGTYQSIYIDDVFIELIPECTETISNLSVVSVGADSINIEFLSDGSTFDIQYRYFDNDNATWNNLTSSSTTVTISNLDADTEYLIRVRSVCELGEEGIWKYISGITHQNPIALPYIYNFDVVAENNNWALRDRARTNKWHIGSTTTGTNTVVDALYISNDGGLSNSYTTSNMISHVYAYRTVSINQRALSVDFDWRAYGEDGWDYLRAFLVPAAQTTELTSGVFNGMYGSSHTVPTDWIDLTNGRINLRSTWQNIQRNIDVPEPGLYNLVFYWKNDVASGTQPPAAVDSISITYVPCPAPSAAIARAITHNSAILNWLERGISDEWNIIVSNTEITDFTGVTPTENLLVTEYSASDLIPETTYYVYVQSICGIDENSTWSPVGQFTTMPTCPRPINITIADITINTANISWTPIGTETEWSIVVSPTAITDFTGVTPTAVLSEATYNVSDLIPNTPYYIYVQANCSIEDNSSWTVAVIFRTLCDMYELPFTEDFNTLTSGIPDCWDNSEGTTTTESYKWNYFATGYTGKCVRFDSYVNSNGRTNFLKTPKLDLTAVTNAELTFMYKNPTGDDFSVFISIDGGITYGTSLITGLTGQTAWTLKTIDISSYVGNDSVMIVFKGTSNYGSGDAYIYLDNVNIRERSNENDIITFEVGGQIGASIINDETHTINITVPFGTDLTNITPIFTISDLAASNPETGAAQNFTNPVSYTITAESGVTQIWVVTITPEPGSTENDILTFQIEDGQVTPSIINAENHTVSLEIGPSLDITSLTPAITISQFATINPLNGVVRDFTNPVNYTVTAQDGTPQIWVVTVTVVYPTINEIDVNNQVENLNVCIGITQEEVRAMLPNIITISDSHNATHFVSLTWAMGGFNVSVPGEYTVIGRFGLPANVLQTDPETPLQITSTITVNSLPVVTCPNNMNVSLNTVTPLTGATPVGGVYTGVGVTNNEFNSTGLGAGPHTITYTYTDSGTTCENSCTFTIGVNQVGIDTPILSDINIYPNPNDGKFSISFGKYSGSINYQIYDTKGSVFVEENINLIEGTKIDLSLNLDPGIYYIRLIIDNKTIVEKITVQ